MTRTAPEPTTFLPPSSRAIARDLGGGSGQNPTERTRTASISGAKTIAELGEYWDSHSVADHWDETLEVSIEVRAVRRRPEPAYPALPLPPRI